MQLCKMEDRSSLCISPFQYGFKSAPKNKTGMCSSSDFDCTSLEYHGTQTLKPLCQGTSAATPGTRNSDSPKNIVHSVTVENSLTLAAWLVSGKSFCVKEFQKTLLTLSQIPDEKARSLILSQLGENGLAGVLNKKLILFRHL